MPKINQEEYEVLKELDDKWKWITRIEGGAMKTFISNPFKNMDFGRSGSWDIKGNKDHAIYTTYSDLFQFIQWEDEEPYNIAELIEEYESEETEVQKDKLWAKLKIREELESWQNIEGGIDEDGIKYVLNIIDQLDEPEKVVVPKFVAEEPKYYAKLKEVHPPEKEWLTNLSGSNYYAIDTKGLMLGEFILELTGIKTEASTHTLKDWERYGINETNADFVEVAE